MPNATMTTLLDRPPISGQYEEVFFDLQEPWRGQNWHYVLFTNSDGQEWCGHFREKESNNFLVGELTEKRIACIVSGGHGYIIDIERKVKIKDLDTETIISLRADNLSSSFYIATYWNLSQIDQDLKENNIRIPIDADGIYLILL